MWPHRRLSDFDKQIQEKHIHEKPNLSNLLNRTFCEALHQTCSYRNTDQEAEIIFYIYIHTGWHTLHNGCFFKGADRLKTNGVAYNLRMNGILKKILFFQGSSTPIITLGFPLFCVYINVRNWWQGKQQVCFPGAQGQCSGLTSGSGSQSLTVQHVLWRLTQPSKRRSQPDRVDKWN